MCAINPVHKKRFIIDVYTSEKDIDKSKFDDNAIHALLQAEIELNKSGKMRFHLKESQLEAD